MNQSNNLFSRQNQSALLKTIGLSESNNKYLSTKNIEQMNYQDFLSQHNAATKSNSIGGNHYASSLSPDKRGGLNRINLNGQRQNSIGQTINQNQKMVPGN